MKSKYVNAEHPTILIDGVPLDNLLHDLYPDDLLLGLIPMMTDWIDLREEAIFVLGRFQSDQERVILPILMCPDDCDLSCTLIVADVIKSDNEVVWNRIGIDSSNIGIPYNYELIGTEVNWLVRVAEMTFEKEDYFEKLREIYRSIKE